jgi:hypothetical protein
MKSLTTRIFHSTGEVVNLRRSYKSLTKNFEDNLHDQEIIQKAQQLIKTSEVDLETYSDRLAKHRSKLALFQKQMSNPATKPERLEKLKVWCRKHERSIRILEILLDVKEG